jgi:hypothetical protein
VLRAHPLALVLHIQVARLHHLHPLGMGRVNLAGRVEALYDYISLRARGPARAASSGIPRHLAVGGVPF